MPWAVIQQQSMKQVPTDQNGLHERQNTGQPTDGLDRPRSKQDEVALKLLYDQTAFAAVWTGFGILGNKEGPRMCCRRAFWESGAVRGLHQDSLSPPLALDGHAGAQPGLDFAPAQSRAPASQSTD